MVQVARFFTVAFAVLLSASAQAQKVETIKVIVGYAPGGASDRAARLVADALREKLGATVIVENKAGAGGRVAAQSFRNTPATEAALMIGNPAVNVVAPLAFKNVGYDPQADFVPVAQVSRYEFGIAVGAAVPVRETNHLLAWLRANPEQANFGVPATGSLPHYFALMLADAAKVKPQVIGYRGSAPLLNDLLGGQVPVAVDTLDTLLPQHAGGKLRILAIGGMKRAPELPNVPTLKEAGLDVVAMGERLLCAGVNAARARTSTRQRYRSDYEDEGNATEVSRREHGPVAAGPEQTRG